MRKFLISLFFPLFLFACATANTPETRLAQADAAFGVAITGVNALIDVGALEPKMVLELYTYGAIAKAALDNAWSLLAAMNEGASADTIVNEALKAVRDFTDLYEKFKGDAS